MKVFKAIISSLIAAILVPIVIVFIVYLSTRSIVSKEGINDLFDEVSLSDVLIDKNGNYTKFGNDIKTELVNYGVPEDVIKEVVDSEQVRDFFSEYAGDAVGYIVYDADLNDIKAEDISNFVNDNIDDIFDELREQKVEGYEELTDERKEQIKAEVNELSKAIEEKLPDVQKMVDDSDYSLPIKIVRIVFSNTMVMVFIVLISIFALLIVLLNLKKYSYGIWLGIICIISALPFIIFDGFKVAISSDIDSEALRNIIKYALSKTSSYAYLFFFIGLGFIAFTIIMRLITKSSKNKDKKVKEVSQPVVEDTPVVEETNETSEEVVTEETPVVEKTPVVEEEIAKEENNVPVTEEKEISYCDSCGAKMEPNQQFCYNCGTEKK